MATQRRNIIDELRAELTEVEQRLIDVKDGLRYAAKCEDCGLIGEAKSELRKVDQKLYEMIIAALRLKQKIL